MARPVADDYEIKRRLLMQAAAHVFATDGYAGAGMAGIAAQAGFSKANIYHYYKNKEDLLFAMLDQYLSKLRDTVCSLILPDDPERALETTIQTILRAYRGEDDIHKVQINELGSLPLEKQIPLKAYQKDIIRFVRDRLEPFGVAESYVVAMSIFGMLNWFYMWNADADESARDAYATKVTNLVLGGLPRL